MPSEGINSTISRDHDILVLRIHFELHGGGEFFSIH